MTDYLLDTNILLRMSDNNSSVHLLATRATANLINQGHQVYITSQNIVEFWVVATRPIEFFTIATRKTTLPSKIIVTSRKQISLGDLVRSHRPSP